MHLCLLVLWECDQAREHQLNSLHFQIYDMDLNLAIQGFSPYGYEIVCLAFQLNWSGLSEKSCRKLQEHEMNYKLSCLFKPQKTETNCRACRVLYYFLNFQVDPENGPMIRSVAQLLKVIAKIHSNYTTTWEACSHNYLAKQNLRYWHHYTNSIVWIVISLLHWSELYEGGPELFY